MKKTGKRGQYKKRPAEQRFWEKVGSHTDPNVCWLWTAATIRGHGGARYGYFRVGDNHVLAHRLSYEMYHHVTIPKGMTIDHVKSRGCTSTLCVNPHHLEVVTNKVNCLRGTSPWAKEAAQTHCVHGHSFNEENTYVRPNGGRDCRICDRERHQKTDQVAHHIMM